MSDEAPVLLIVEDGIARLRLNRPEASNALPKPLFAALALLASGAPEGQAAAKRLFWDGVGRSFEEGLPDESRTVSALGGTADAREGMAAVLERRAPRFGAR